MSSVTITDIPKWVDIPNTMSYNAFLEHTLETQNNFDVDLQFTDYKDLTKEEQKEIDYIASLDESRFVNL